ncbi:uncharacterized protein LOC129598690 [Paramacrobiotus metropolitanus]|uniref:uncharacterized protein LOC129598690 n=1 Tax=Paramacrobiotus metropolitanus TaxID=2943436 RepID=UPI0024459C40|nr:uncharacterized protein LOC129598690 [Paramacrobiotus metropolitanus]
MRTLLGSQILQEKADPVSIPAEVHLIRIIQGKRGKKGWTGAGWRSWSAAISSPDCSLIPQEHPCKNHVLKGLKTAVIDGISVWTDAYRKPKRTLVKYFLVTNRRTKQKKYVRVHQLLMCSDCIQLLFIGYIMRPEFIEPNIVRLFSHHTPLSLPFNRSPASYYAGSGLLAPLSL